MKKIIISIIMVAAFASCKKDKASEQKYCWDLFDNNGNSIGSVCDKTEEEFLNCLCGTFNGVSNKPIKDILTNCNYERRDLPKFCYECRTANNATYFDFFCTTEERLTCLANQRNITCRKK